MVGPEVAPDYFLSRLRHPALVTGGFHDLGWAPLLTSVPPSPDITAILPFCITSTQEEKEAEELLKMIQAKRGPDALANMASDRKRQMSSFLDSLEDKYATGKEKKKGKVRRGDW